MFAELTGPKSAKNVILATTKWDKLHFQLDRGDGVEKGLEESYWNVMIHHGAAVERFFNTSDSAWSIVDNIVNKNDRKAALLFQEERVDQKKPFKKTSAGQALSLRFDQLLERQKKMMQEATARSSPSGSVILSGQDTE
jgi:hypothetical protein